MILITVKYIYIYNGQKSKGWNMDAYVEIPKQRSTPGSDVNSLENKLNNIIFSMTPRCPLKKYLRYSEHCWTVLEYFLVTNSQRLNCSLHFRTSEINFMI